jgi:Mg2+/Co2+ transporter CorB
LLSALFAGSETAFLLLAKDRNALQRIKNEQGENATIIKLLQHPGRLLMSILLGNLFVNLCFFACSSIYIVKVNNTVSVGAGVLLSVFFLMCVLLFGEIIPKTIATVIPVPFSKKTAGIINIMVTGLSGVTFVLHHTVVGINRLFGIDKVEDESIHSEQLEDLVDVSELNGSVSGVNADIIVQLIKMNTIRLKEIAKPRVDVLACSVNDTLAKVLKLSHEWGYHTVPLYANHSEEIVRYIELPETIGYEDKNVKVVKFAKRLPFLPELMMMDQVLRIFLENQYRLAVVVNEYGEMSGLVSWEAVVACVNSQMEDIEVGEEKDQIRILSGRASLRDVFSTKEIEEENYDSVTLSGFLISHLEDFPQEGEVIIVKHRKFVITKANKKNIEEVLVSTIKEEENH